MHIPTRFHGAFDYLLGVSLIAAPWLLGFAGGGAETWTPVAVGGATLAYTLLTDYELGVLRRLSIPAHLWLDGLGGMVLAVSPWLFGFDEVVWAPHLAAGILAVVVASFTDTVPGHERRRIHQR